MDLLKLKAFEYVLHKLLEWHQEVTKVGINDISILKSLKLLFFVSAVKASKDKISLVDSVFNNFVAMPYGHVESDVYNGIKNKELTTYIISNSKTEKNEGFEVDVNFDDKLVQLIDESFKELKIINQDLIKMSSFELVELSHCWYSWQHYYTKARNRGVNSIEIPVDVIKGEEKIFVL